jgi:hypothetical protein
VDKGVDNLTEAPAMRESARGEALEGRWEVSLSACLSPYEGLRCSNMPAEPPNTLNARMARLEGSYEQINHRLANLETGLNRLEDKMEARFDHLDRKIDASFDKLDKKIDSRFNMIALLGAILVALQVLSALDII